ncbi:restin isoform b [Yersinia mollaretii ATCC 43969]|uniref:Restin isoform b n=1 Tax=Yersinia mollaretii (strain ATCC 43969 / DSM 18520 / CIP 103324 / CNY 7263 / WAIP 204) TaxID=349967 RepID=A0ABP2EHB7_YERMW|nr:hypothetical protein [Yersinia mollaretii]EEQ11883.1 restin isoform b [Yersinia mollaretii ATCC 43969]QKJ02814.1 hypothetical protein HRD69_07250 [Yersinia mollaretii ATCC 43969]
MKLKAMSQNTPITNNTRKPARLPGCNHTSVVENSPTSDKLIGSNLTSVNNAAVKFDRKEVNQQTWGERLSGLIRKITTLFQAEKKSLEGPKLLKLQNNPLPSRIASHALINQFTPKAGGVASDICSKICNSHSSGEVSELINKCNNALKNAGIEFIEVKELYENQLVMAFKKEFGHALSTGSHLLDIQKEKEKVTGVQSIEHTSDSQKLIDLIQDYQELPENKLEMRLEIKLKPTIPSPFRKEGYIETQADKDEAIAINTKNYGNTESTQNSQSAAYDSLSAEYKREDDRPNRQLKSEPKYHEIKVEVNNKKIEDEFKEDRKNTINTSIKSYKFLQENAPAIFKLEDSLQ